MPMPPASNTLPNFFIVGAPKAGSTSLYHYLDQHPEIYMSPIKEPNYFASEIRPENFAEDQQPQLRRDARALEEYLRGTLREKRHGALISRWDDYVKLFQNVNGEKAIGEASVCYLWSQTAAANIAAKIPDARVVMMLRDPAERAFSQYLQGLTNGWMRGSFRRYIEASQRSHEKQFGKPFAFLQLGLYSEQVQRYLRLFPRENVRIGWYEEYRRDLAGTLAALYRFLNVDSSFAADTSRKHFEPRVPKFATLGYFLKKFGIWEGAKRLSPRRLRPFLRSAALKDRQSLVMRPDDRAYLVDYYQEDIRKLADLLERDLSSWLRT